jgi:hypothetical protein
MRKFSGKGPLPSVPAVQPTPAFRPIEASTVAIRYVRNTSTPDGCAGVAFAQLPVVRRRLGEPVKSTLCGRTEIEKSGSS